MTSINLPPSCEGAAEATRGWTSNPAAGEQASTDKPVNNETGGDPTNEENLEDIDNGDQQLSQNCRASETSLSGDVNSKGTSSPGKHRDSLEISTIQRAEAALETLYEAHDRFFSPDKGEKHRLLTAKAGEVLDALALVEDVRDIKQRARVSYIRGRALDVFSDFDPEAEKCLARAVKLHPTDPDGWNALGHCFWKKKDLLAAKSCFGKALDKGRKPESLRQLSMLLRQVLGTPEESSANLQGSLRLAKEAVTLDPESGDSWYVLGNAYVASFFRLSGGMKDLDRALQAYKKAESSNVNRNPDLFFNRAQVLNYREDYPEAIRDYRAALEVDPLLPVAPALDAIETGVRRRVRLVHRRGGLKPKRLAQLVKPLKGDSVRKGLGDSYRLLRLKDLRRGVNKGVALALKLITPAEETSQPPERLVVADANEECAVLSLYSTTKQACSKIQAKDVLVVRNPYLRTISFDSRPSKLGGTPTTHPPPAAEQRCVQDANGSTDVTASTPSKSSSTSSSSSSLPSFQASTAEVERRQGVDVKGLDSREEGSVLSYLGIRADPGEVLLNGASMMVSFAPTAVRLDNFDK